LPRQLCIVGSLNVFLFSNKALLMLNILPVIQIGHVLLGTSVPQVCQLITGHSDVLLRLHGHFLHANLFVFNLVILLLQLV
jgi:hypothetical protein